ncbi:MAG: hypothetical protein ACRC0G_07305 [Fusobacteriaceae bacterium]
MYDKIIAARENGIGEYICADLLTFEQILECVEDFKLFKIRKENCDLIDLYDHREVIYNKGVTFYYDGEGYMVFYKKIDPNSKFVYLVGSMVLYVAALLIYSFGGVFA